MELPRATCVEDRLSFALKLGRAFHLQVVCRTKFSARRCSGYLGKMHETSLSVYVNVAPNVVSLMSFGPQCSRAFYVLKTG